MATKAASYASTVRPVQLPVETTQPVVIKNVLVATDFSLAANKGVRYAAEIASRYGAMLYAAHVYNPEIYPYSPPYAWAELAEGDRLLRAQGRAELEEQLKGISHELIFQEGEVCAALNDLVRTKRADVLVLGTHGRNGLERVLMGSVAEKIFREARCPVLTVGPKVAEKFRSTELTRILFATDFTADSIAAAPYAISLARQYRAHLILLNCADAEPERVQHLLEELRNLVPLGADLRCEPICVVERGSHADKILSVAEGHGTDLIVLGIDGAAEGKQRILSRHSSLYKIATQATVPVLTIRN